ncbi:hypothetical protein TWF281_004885 [Arthrobotrys megalospora]
MFKELGYESDAGDVRQTLSIINKACQSAKEKCMLEVGVMRTDCVRRCTILIGGFGVVGLSRWYSDWLM